MIKGYPRGPRNLDEQCPNCKSEVPVNWKKCPACGFVKSPAEVLLWSVLFVVAGIPFALLAIGRLIAALAGNGQPMDFVLFMAMGILACFLFQRMRQSRGKIR